MHKPLAPMAINKQSIAQEYIDSFTCYYIKQLRTKKLYFEDSSCGQSLLILQISKLACAKLT